jgi:hypothetical protein
LIATRLGKTPDPDSVSAPLPPFPPQVAAHSERRRIDAPMRGEVILIRALAADDMIALQGTVSDEGAAPFLRAAQLFVGLCANDVVIAGERDRRAAGKALSAYAAQAAEEIGRIFARAKLSRAPAPFRPADSDFDDAARAVLTALEPAFA